MVYSIVVYEIYSKKFEYEISIPNISTDIQLKIKEKTQLTIVENIAKWQNIHTY